MDLKQVIDRLTIRLTRPLPGAVAHEPMRARPVGNLIPKFDLSSPPKLGGVMILLYPFHNSIKFPLTKRADYPGAHSGQISLPGGKAEPGENILETALRECEEETGVPRKSIEIIGRLTDFHVLPSNFLVSPVIGVTWNKPLFNPDPVEVVRILEADVFDLTRRDSIKEKEILAANRYQMQAPHFEVEGEIVWGATAMMLNEFRMVVNEVL